MKIRNEKINLMANAETLGIVHTHTCSFIGLNNAIFAFINNIKKTNYELSS